MNNEVLHYFPLVAAALASIVALLQARRMKQLRPKSHKFLSRGVIGLAVAFGGSLFITNESFELAVAGLAILSLAFGLVVLGKELKVVGVIIREQRVDFETGIYNRRAFDERLFAEHSRTKRTGIGYAIAVFEIDDYNDLSGSDKTNSVKLLAKTMRESVSHTDTLARISQTQIAVLMVDTRAEEGIIGVERARAFLLSELRSRRPGACDQTADDQRRDRGVRRRRHRRAGRSAQRRACLAAPARRG